MPSIPSEITPLLQSWLAALEQSMAPVHGVYLFGSLALNDWNPAISDIDVIVATNGTLSAVAVQALAAMHANLAQEPMATRLEVMYLPLAHVSIGNTPIPAYPCYRDGGFLAASQGDMNAVTGWLLHHRGITLMGPSAQECFPAVPWSAIERAMTYNLDTYWKDKAEHGGILFLQDFWVEFAVTTLCRIMTTLHRQDIVSKEAALRDWQFRIPGRWRLLLEEAFRLRRQPYAKSLYRSSAERMEDTIAFVTWVRSRAWLTLPV